MIYPYHCDNCNNDFEVIKHYSRSADPELCEKCGTQARYVFTIPQVNTEVCHQEAEYNPAFGCIVKDKYHRNELAKRNNMIEVGNEKVEAIHKAAASTHKQIMRSYDD